MRFLDALLGHPLASADEHKQKVGVFAGIPMLGLDALSSAAYGPEAALTILIVLGSAGQNYAMPIIGVIIAILLILYVSYRQTIAAYPNGGGSYTVAKENLGTNAGLLAAAALVLDYVLVVAVGVSAGVGALISAIPALHPYVLLIGLVIVVLVTIVNLRGVRESGLAFAIPTYVFVFALAGVIAVGVWKSVASGGHPNPIELPTPAPSAVAGVTLWLLMRSFASGCTAMTGVEAVSNGIQAFAPPTTRNAQRTLTAIIVILSVFLAGIAYLCHTYKVNAVDPDSPAYQSIISQLTAAIAGRGFVYYVTIGGTLAVLALSANTGFADFPRLCRLVAEDDYLPHAFATRGRRLVYSLGITIIAVFSGLLLIAFGGITDRLIPLFAIGAFLAFTLSQAGMVRHWFRLKTPGWKLSAFFNGLGAVSTGVALLVVLIAKFAEGAWITCILIPLVVVVFLRVKRHYEHVVQETRLNRQFSPQDRVSLIAVVPVHRWSIVTEKALSLAMGVSSEVIAIHVSTTGADTLALGQQWERLVAEPCRAQSIEPPKLSIISSPYRRVFTPIIDYVAKLSDDNPEQVIAVIIPELVESRWYQYLLHNQRATALKAALLLRGGKRVVVMNVPWYLGSPVRVGASG